MDTIGNFLTSIRNGIMASKRMVDVPFSNMKMEIANVLKEEGYVKDFQKIEVDSKPVIRLFLKYVNGESAINEIKRVSRPGRRVYEGVRNVKNVIGGLGISVISTNKGIVTDRRARELSCGGEVVCHIW